MSDQPRPNLTLGPAPGGLRRATGPISGVWLWGFLLLQVAALAALGVLLMRQARQTPLTSAASAAPHAEELKNLARELEEKSLSAQAARAWQAYLDAAPDAPQRGEIFYRIGTLSMDAEQFGEAVTALVRAEALCEDSPELKAKIGPKVVECLRRLGRYGEVGRELARRVEAGADKKARPKVLATVGGQPLTEADLDRRIERRVDDLLAMQGGAADPATRQAVLRQLSGPEARSQMLQELLQTELFCRRARELKLDREEDYLRAREQLEENLLARRFLARELEKIQPTDVDVDAYYQANKARYEEPESLQVVAIRLNEKEDPAALLAKIRSADDFRKVADQRRPTAGKGGEPLSRRVFRGRDDPSLGKTESLFDLAEGQWTKTPHVQAGGRHLVLIEKKLPARTPLLAEVQTAVEADYTARKQKETAERLLGDLMARYDVRIVAPDAGAKPASGEK